MEKKNLIVWGILAILVSFPAFAVNDIKNLNNRLNSALKTEENPLKTFALEELCKKKDVADKVCSVQNLVTKGEYAIVVVLNKDKLAYGLFNKSSEKWKLVLKGDESELSLNHIQKKKPQIPKNLIEELVTQARKKAGLK